MSALRHGRPLEVERWATFGIDFSEEHQLEVGLTTLRMLRCELQLRRGEWAEADSGLAEIVADPDLTSWGQSAACTLLGRLRARQGGDDALELLGRGWRLALQSDEPERIARAGAGWFEWAHLHDDDQARRRGEEAIEIARRSGNPWLLGELLRLRVDGPSGDDDGLADRMVHGVAEPWASGVRGDWRAAADAWASLGFPFEQARELAASGDVDRQVEALAIYDRLGATRTARRLRQAMRDQGVDRIPRGPARETLANPAGLTGRQLEVLRHLARGLTNAQIAGELVLSIRTVDNHVSAILAKLDAGSRVEAADAAVRLGLVAPDAGDATPAPAG